jgi:hypothetical protein
MAKPKVAEDKIAPERFVIDYKGKPALEVRWLSDVVFDEAAEHVEGWLTAAAEIEREGITEIENAATNSRCSPDEIEQAKVGYTRALATCPLYTQSPEAARKHVRRELPAAIHDLLHLLSEEAYYLTAADLNQKCQLPHHRRIHTVEDYYLFESLVGTHKRQLFARLGLEDCERRGGNKTPLIREPHTRLILAKEYANLQSKNHGDNGDKTLWEIICHRYDNGDPNWRARATLDCNDVPAAVLDLVGQRSKFSLKTSHLALYHAATRAGISFTITTHPTNGSQFITPSPSTLFRGCAKRMTGTKRIAKRKYQLVKTGRLPV